MPATTTNPRAKMLPNTYRGKPTGGKERASRRFRVRIVPMPVYQVEATPRAKVRFELPVSGGRLDAEYEEPCCPVWTDRRAPARGHRLRAWLRRVRNSLSCFN